MVTFDVEGNSEGAINNVVVICLVGVAMAAAFGVSIDALRRPKVYRDSTNVQWVSEPAKPPTTPSWVVLLLLVGYGLLVPGLLNVLFSFNIMVDLTFFRFGLGPNGGVDKTPPVTESMLGLVNLLWTTDCALGAVAVVFYAMFIPALKLVLVFLGQLFWQHPASTYCIHTVHSISKWACPDMFAYILIMHLVRGLNHPMLLQSKFRLDVGFTCFSIFCVVSTIASLGVDSRVADGGGGCWHRVAHCLGLRGSALTVALLCLGFSVLFAIGVSSPMMSLRIRLDNLYAPNGPLPASMMGFPVKPIIDTLHIPEKANSDVSLIDAVGACRLWAEGGEFNCYIAFVMLAVFVLGMTVADMVTLAALAVGLFTERRVHPYAKIAVALRKLSMLDVLTVGVAVVTWCMTMYHKDGVFISMQAGQVGLIIAEILHYATYYLVMGMVRIYSQPNDEYGTLLDAGLKVPPL